MSKIMTNKILTLILCLLMLITDCHSLDIPVTLNGNCSSAFKELDVWKRGVTHDREALTCRLHTTESCSNGELPSNVGGTFMGSPESLHVEGVLIDVPNQPGDMAPQLVVTWEPPRQAAGFENLKGFYMEIQRIAGHIGNDFICRVFDFTASNFTSDDYKLKFRKKFVGLPGGPNHVYLLTMYSLPKDSNSVAKKQFFSLQNQIVANNTANWDAAVSYDLENVTAPAIVRFEFSLAPSIYEFKQYFIQLVNVNDDKNAAISCYLKVDERYECQGIFHEHSPDGATFASHSFLDVQPGTYQLWIQPRDPFWQEDTNCLCYHGYVDGKRKCDRCMTTVTQSFTVGGSTPSPSTSTASTSTSTSKSSAAVASSSAAAASEPTEDGQSPISQPVTSGGDGNDTPVIVTAVIMGLVLGLFLVGLLFYVRRRRGSRWSLPTFMNPKPPGLLEPQALARRSVYLLYANDHSEHVNVVGKFAMFLKERCNCNVFYLPWYQGAVRTATAGEWVFSHIDKADNVIIINSEAAFNLYEARNTDVSYSFRDEGPEGDTFNLGITHVMAKSGHADFYKKTILAYFDYTQEEHIVKDISPGVQYSLPKHLKEFLCHIHEVESFGMNPRQLEINSMESLDNAEGRSWTEAITKAKHFQKSNKGWFSERFHRQDSAYESNSNNEDLTDSASTSPEAYTGAPPFSQRQGGDLDDDLQSAVTYNTNYINSQRYSPVPPSDVDSRRYSPIPPSDVDTLATFATEDINKKFETINEQSLQNAYYENENTGSPYYKNDCPALASSCPSSQLTSPFTNQDGRHVDNHEMNFMNSSDSEEEDGGGRDV